MKPNEPYVRVARAVAAICIGVLLASCDGGGGSAPATGSGSGLTNSPNRPNASQPLLYVPNAQPFQSISTHGNSVTVLPANGNGNVNAVQFIKGPSTQLNDPGGVALDSSGNIYVANVACCAGNPSPPSITAYAPNANGDAAPIRVISGSSTELALPGAVVFDQSNNLDVADLEGGPPPGLGAIYVFAPGADGNVAPMTTIVGPKTDLSIPRGIALDVKGNIYVTNADSGPCGASGAITVYPPGASGDIAPVAFIGGDKTGISGPLGIALDSTGNIYVANVGGLGSVTVYAAGSHGNVAPIETFQVTSPAGIALDPQGNIYVSSLDSINVYAPGSTGKAMPIRTMSGTNTGITAPETMTLR